MAQIYADKASTCATQERLTKAHRSNYMRCIAHEDLQSSVDMPGLGIAETPIKDRWLNCGASKRWERAIQPLWGQPLCSSSSSSSITLMSIHIFFTLLSKCLLQLLNLNLSTCGCCKDLVGLSLSLLSFPFLFSYYMCYVLNAPCSVSGLPTDYYTVIPFHCLSYPQLGGLTPRE